MSSSFSLDKLSMRYGKKDVDKARAQLPQTKIRDVKKSEFFSNSPPSIFIGSKLKYPAVNVGVLAPPEHVEDAEIFDSHKRWVGEGLAINDILKLRANLINSRFQTDVHSAKQQGKFLLLSQEIGMAHKPVDIEVSLRKKIKVSLELDKVTTPQGARAPLKSLEITENVRIARPVDKVTSDTDLKAAEALKYLYKKHYDDQMMNQLLSLGTLGLGKNRKLVPTRYSITATDDTIGKFLLKEIRDYQQLSDYQLFYGHYLGNHYLVLLFPDIFSYELFEMYLPGSNWNTSGQLTIATDHEYYDGRTNYASNCAGGYYASRRPLLDYLQKIKRQGTAIVLRFETPSYWAGLGVWVVREAMKSTMQQKALAFSSREEMIQFGAQIIREELGFDIHKVLKDSKLLGRTREQKRLLEFFN